jgi:hypothetical protein
VTVRATVVGVAVLLLACRPAETTTSDATTSGAADTSTSSVDSSSSDGATSTTEETSSSDTGMIMPPPKLCSLAVIDPSTDPETAVEDGDAEDQIPTVIGDALVRNCGCHYTDNVMVGLYVDYKSNAQPMRTLADFHGNFTGIFPAGFETMPAYVAVEERVVAKKPLPMPPHGCGVEGETGTMTMADVELFTEWLAAGAPSGASFPSR